MSESTEAEFWLIVFASWTCEELTWLTVGADAWTPRDMWSVKV